MMNRALSAGMLATLASLSACVVDEVGSDRAPPGENVDSVGLAVLTGIYTASPNERSSGFPLGVCGYTSDNNKNNRQLNDNNAAYDLDWVPGSEMCVKLNLRGSTISAACTWADGNVAGEIDYTARCVSQATKLRKILMPIKWGLVDTSTYNATTNPNSTPCLTKQQSDALNSSGDLIDLGTVSATWPGRTTPLGVGTWKIFRHDNSSGPRYQHEMLAYGGSTGSFLTTIQAADPAKANLDDVVLCMADGGTRQMPASYNAKDCVGFQQSESIDWYPAEAPYGFYDVSDHGWCPVSKGSWP